MAARNVQRCTMKDQIALLKVIMNVKKVIRVLQKEGVTVETENSRQMNLFEFLAENYENMPNDKVNVEGVINIATLTDFTVQSTYRDIFVIINMLDDYVGILTQQHREFDYYTNYMIQQFDRISKELSEQIGLDKEKIYKKCQRRTKNEKDNVGEDAMILALAGKE